MSDDTDITTGGDVAPAPSESRTSIPSAPDEKSRDQQIREQFKAGLNLMAHGTESAEDYIKERRTQEKFLNDEDMSGAQMQEWHSRTHQALQRAANAAARVRGEAEPFSAQQPSEENIPGYIGPEHPHYDAIIDANKDRFSDYFDDPNNIGSSMTAAEHKKSVTDWITTFDPKNVLIGHFMASPLGPQMMEALEGEGEAIKYLANLPPQQRAREVAKLEGFVHARQMMAAEGGAPQAPQPRRVSQAPAPIRPPRGGANVPKDLHSLATKDNAADYIKARQERERRYRDKWE